MADRREAINLAVMLRAETCHAGKNAVVVVHLDRIRCGQSLVGQSLVGQSLVGRRQFDMNLRAIRNHFPRDRTPKSHQVQVQVEGVDGVVNDNKWAPQTRNQEFAEKAQLEILKMILSKTTCFLKTTTPRRQGSRRRAA